MAELLGLDNPRIKEDLSYGSHLCDQLQYKLGITTADELRSHTQEIGNNVAEVTEFVANM